MANKKQEKVARKETVRFNLHGVEQGAPDVYVHLSWERINFVPNNVAVVEKASTANDGF